jgi:shikimate kinase
MGKKFIDSDHEIERRTGVSIPTIFDIEGEEGFRTRETAVIDELTQQRGIVLATGGGAILRPENRSFLSARGLVIYLNASVDQLHRRTRMDRNRPLLQTDDPRARLQSLFDERDVLYREVADLVTGTDERSVQQAIPELIHKIEQL